MWSERYDREMKDVFEVQDEIARKIAEALRVTLSPQELEALAVKPTENLQAYDLYLRGKRYARRQTRQDLEFALQMFENAVAIDASFALAYAACANACAMFYCNYSRDVVWVERARKLRAKPWPCVGTCPKFRSARRGFCTPPICTTKLCGWCRKPSSAGATAKARIICCAAHCSLQDAIRKLPTIMEVAIEASGEDYNVYVPIMNALNALGKPGANRNILLRCIAALENHLKQVPEDARARILLGSNYAELGRVDDAMRETNLAITLRANEASILYNAACTYCFLKRKPEALETIAKAWEAGFKDSSWARKDPDLAMSTRRSGI